MSEKICLYLLLFCAILMQGIFATFSDKDNKASSHLLVRERRVINHLPEGRNAMRIESVYYIVRIREGSQAICTGAILSHYTVITAALCIRRHLVNYKVLSGGAYDNRSNFHNVTSSVTYYGALPHQSIDGIALITVDPLFEYSQRTKNIHLHLAPMPAGTVVTVSGWGCFYPIQHGPETRPKLHSITLPIMNHEECDNIYLHNAHYTRNVIGVTQKHICTFSAQQYCARNDAGAPLVVDNLLAGIHVWKGEFPEGMNPDIYINLQRADYRDWINENALLM